jgi:hypothetical protein
MKFKLSTFLMLLLAAPLTSFAGEQLIPAGSLLSCTVAEPKLSSKTANIGDPVMCKVSHVEMYGRSTLPYGTYMVGRFEDYKDPGHFVGKGWMELKFDHMVIEPDTVIPVEARVVSVPGYNVDRYGRILGKGHPVRDIVEWSIPILWPLDLINLPRRGPRPTLKEETRLTLKVMDDFGVPPREPLQEESPGLYRRPSAYQPSDYQPPAPAPQPAPQPVVVYVQQPPPPPVVQYVMPMYPAMYVYQPMYMPMPVAPAYYPVPAAPAYMEPPPQQQYYAPAMARSASPYARAYSPAIARSASPYARTYPPVIARSASPYARTYSPAIAQSTSPYARTYSRGY